MNKDNTENNQSPNEIEDQEMYEHYHVQIDRGQEPLRIDKYLINHIPNISRNKFQLAAKAGSILVNNLPVKSNYKVKPLDVISVVLAKPPVDFKLLPDNIPLDIEFEDEELMIINKPAGLVVHPGSGNFTGTLANGLLYHFKDLPTNQENRPGLIHRIDKNTSGLMLIAKSDFAMTFLAKQFFEKTIKRVYHALVWGDIEDDEGTIEGNIGRNLRYRKKMDVFPEADHGKPAVTHYKVLRRFHYVTLIECRLETGRTHQIRVHVKHIKHPIFNDEVYGGDKIVKGTVYTKYKQFVTNCFKIMDHQALHAKTIGFIHPITKEEVHFESDLPPDFQQVIEKWDTYTSSLKKES